MIRTGVDLKSKTVEEFEELLTKLTTEFGYREMALKLRERQDKENDGYYGNMNGKYFIDKEFLDNAHKFIIDYVNN